MISLLTRRRHQNVPTDGGVLEMEMAENSAYFVWIIQTLSPSCSRIHKIASAAKSLLLPTILLTIAVSMIFGFQAPKCATDLNCAPDEFCWLQQGICEKCNYFFSIGFNTSAMDKSNTTDAGQQLVDNLAHASGELSAIYRLKPGFQWGDLPPQMQKLLLHAADRCPPVIEPGCGQAQTVMQSSDSISLVVVFGFVAYVVVDACTQEMIQATCQRCLLRDELVRSGSKSPLLDFCSWLSWVIRSRILTVMCCQLLVVLVVFDSSAPGGILLNGLAGNQITNPMPIPHICYFYA